jgi:MFS transporter, AAHS family, 4-hydroxybenzoate transporter
VYTTSIRATGTAWALAFGRIGSISSAFLGAILISAGGASAYLELLGVSMALVTVSLLVIKRHIPAVRADERLIEKASPVSVNE